MKKFMILAIILSSTLGIYLKDDSLLCGQTKKQKQEKLAKKKKNQKQPVAVVPDKKADEMAVYYNYTAKENQAILQQIVILSDRLESRIFQLEDVSLYHDEQIAEIKDCMYKKYIDSSFCPFEYFKRWFDDPFNKSGINISRHTIEQ